AFAAVTLLGILHTPHGGTTRHLGTLVRLARVGHGTPHWLAGFLAARDTSIDATHLADAIRPAAHSGGGQRPPAPPAGPRGRAYGQAALRGELDALRAAQPGGRNQTLNTAWLKLMRLIRAGLLDYTHARAEVEAAISPWIGQPGSDGAPFTRAEAHRTMASAERAYR